MASITFPAGNTVPLTAVGPPYSRPLVAVVVVPLAVAALPLTGEFGWGYDIYTNKLERPPPDGFGLNRSTHTPLRCYQFPAFALLFLSPFLFRPLSSLFLSLFFLIHYWAALQSCILLD
ncbi:hypothetical protein CALVIDRAFT_534823 [Calocera viscosa TUFC12733]|uniref:Uncharacterized protein n=1 Tax=Calocera viscosa (strain TUFC12733) TaxID=1330018 RepID=A0A167PFC8_CALVF|nr:hypothetical protein CALVIDRAFT_534823 [Calocera viscosa TUFC12733]